jgi:16S rRNA (guanine966-N2)-methyltransferase
VRIIGGQWRRSKLPVLDKPGLRPTPDRVRETLFNWLGQDLTGWQVLDAFAGTGALGMEAASRGAARVCMIEQDAAVVRQLQANAQRLKADNLDIRQGNALTIMASLPAQTWDVVFLDPPFAADLFDAALAASQRLLGAGGQVYLESDKPLAGEQLSALGWALHRHLKAGAVHAHLLVRHLAV